KVLVKREVLLDHQLADAIGGDRLGWRRLRSRHDLRVSVNRTARGQKYEALQAKLAAKIKQRERGEHVVADIACHVGIGWLRRRRMDEVVKDIEALDCSGKRIAIAKVASAKFNPIHRIGKREVAAKRSDASA